MGNQDPANTTPLSAIPAFPGDLTKLDLFQYINYALFGTVLPPLTLTRTLSFYVTKGRIYN